MNNKNDTILQIVEQNKSIDFDSILNQLENYPIYIENKRELADILSKLEEQKSIIYFANQYVATKDLEVKKGWITPGAKAGVFFTTEKPTLELGANYTLDEDTAYSLITKRGAIPNQEVECFMVPVGNNSGTPAVGALDNAVVVVAPTQRYAAYTKQIIRTNEFEFLGVLEADKIKAFIKGFELELGRHVLNPDDALDYQPGDWGHFLYTPGIGAEPAQLELLEHITQRNKKGFESEIGSYMLSEAVKRQAQAHANFEMEFKAEPKNQVDMSSLVYRDLTSLPFMTIDSINTRDIDDAICRVREDKNTRLIVAIADVSSKVLPGDAADKAAFVKTSTFYLPHKTEHMLDANLAEKEFSLNPGVEKQVMCADMLFSETGELLSEEFYPARIVSSARLTYDDVDRFFEGRIFEESKLFIGSQMYDFAKITSLERTSLHNQPEVKAVSEQLEDIFALRQNVEKRKTEKIAQKAAQDKLDNPLDNAVVQQLARDDMYRPARVEWTLGEDGEIKELKLEAEAGPAQKIVEFSMIAANISAAQFMYDKYPTTALFRNQAPTLDGEKTKPAAYSSTVSGHSSLDTGFYTHFTSPIRRYCDLVVHRILKETILGGRSLTENWLEQVAAHINTMAVRSKAVDMKISQFIMNRYVAKLHTAGRTMFETKLVDFYENGAVFRSPEHIEFFVPAFKVDKMLGDKIYAFMQAHPEKPVAETKAFLHEVNLLSYPIELMEIDPVLDKKMAGPKREPRFQRGAPAPKR